MVAGMVSSVRKPAVAGLFYPGDGAELRATVSGFLKEARNSLEPVGRAPKALIVPHAGYLYSGSVAASAYSRIENAAGRITRVLLLGPAHRLSFEGVALPGVDGFETPLGIVPLDVDAIARIEHLPQVVRLPSAHAGEHSLEVHLPFLQTLMRQFSVTLCKAPDGKWHCRGLAKTRRVPPRRRAPHKECAATRAAWAMDLCRLLERFQSNMSHFDRHFLLSG